MEASGHEESILQKKCDDIYAAVRLNLTLRLRSVISEDVDTIGYIRSAKYPPKSSTLLHIAARYGADKIIDVKFIYRAIYTKIT